MTPDASPVAEIYLGRILALYTEYYRVVLAHQRAVERCRIILLWRDDLIMLYFLIAIALYILNAIAFFKLAEVAGRRDIAWMAWVPILNAIQQLLLIRKSGWWVLMYLVPIANFVLAIIWQVKLLNAFGKHGAFVLFFIFLSPIYEILWIVWGLSDDTRYTLPITRGYGA